ncbi:hypothetical protein M514_05743, partial [Trichuris suis]
LVVRSTDRLKITVGRKPTYSDRYLISPLTIDNSMVHEQNTNNSLADDGPAPADISRRRGSGRPAKMKHRQTAENDGECDQRTSGHRTFLSVFTRPPIEERMSREPVFSTTHKRGTRYNTSFNRDKEVEDSEAWVDLINQTRYCTLAP